MCYLYPPCATVLEHRRPHEGEKPSHRPSMGFSAMTNLLICFLLSWSLIEPCEILSEAFTHVPDAAQELEAEEHAPKPPAS